MLRRPTKVLSDLANPTGHAKYIVLLVVFICLTPMIADHHEYGCDLTDANIALSDPGLGFRRDVVPRRAASGHRRGGRSHLTARSTRTRAPRQRRLTRQVSTQIPCSRGTRSEVVGIQTSATMAMIRTRRRTSRAT